MGRASGWPLAILALVLGLALALRGRALLAAWQFNLGALAQARAELALYDAERAADPTLDEVRRRVDLAPAEARYEQALALDPGHALAQTGPWTAPANLSQSGAASTPAAGLRPTHVRRAEPAIWPARRS